MALGNVDYWRTFREFDSNASVIADQPQDVVTFRGGQNIYLQFNEGDDIITWNVDLPGLAEEVTANLSVTNDPPANPSMLTYDPATGEFTYTPPDLSVYATIAYVDQAVTDGINDLDLSEYATKVWVQGYVGTAVPDLTDYATISYVDQSINDLSANINEQIDAIERGYTGSKGDTGSSVKIVGAVDTYLDLLTRPKWTNYLGDLGDGVILRDTGNLAVSIDLGPPTLWEDVGPVQGPQGYDGSKGDTGFNGSQGYTGSAIVVGHTVFEQNVASNFWAINHNLGVQYLSVELVDDSSNSIVGTYGYPTVTFVDEGNLTITWTEPATGYAVLSAGGGSDGPVGFTGSRGFTGSTGTSDVTTVFTFATLPVPTTGARAFISDSDQLASGAFGLNAAGGGANTVPVFYNGSSWLIG